MQIRTFISSAIRKTQNTVRALRKNKTTTEATDIFVKQEPNGVLPPKIQSYLDSFSPYEQNAKEFWGNLYKLSPEKFEIMNTCEQFSYVSKTNSDELFDALEKLTPKEIKKTLDEITELFKQFPKELIIEDAEKEIYKYETKIPDSFDIANLTILKANQKETYEYILNHPNKEAIDRLLADASYNNIKGSTFQTLTPAQLRQMTLEGIEIQRGRKCTSAMSQYVESSDTFSRNSDAVKELHEYLSGSKTLEDFTAFRGERDTGMFESIPIDKKLALKTRLYILRNFNKARKVTVAPYTGNHSKYFDKKMNLLKYIFNKKELSLADAMQVAKFGDEGFRDEIIKLIKAAKIKDTRFKSLTFDRQMASGWTNTSGTGNTSILQNITLKKGASGQYSHINNDQVEFILNNNEKILTFEDVKYDPTNDLFIFDSTIY